MTKTTQFTIGADARCTDGECGEVIRIVVDPIAQTVTHLVVEPKHRRGLGKLVPVDLIDSSADEVHLRCTVAEFDKLESAEETKFLPGTAGYEGYSSEQILAWPYFGLGGGGMLGFGVGNAEEPVVYDTLPVNEVAVRRNQQVHATDGDIGRVQGLVIDRHDHHVTHVVLQEGHLWGRKQVAIPISAVTDVDDGIGLNLTKEEVQDLPAVDFEPQRT